MSNQIATTTAFSVERIRAELLEAVRPPKALLQRAFAKLEQKLEAKETKFFTFKGSVQEQVDVDDHATQLSAADKILNAAGVYARERDSKPPTPAMAVEYDPVTGVLRMVIGAVGALAPLPTGGDSNVTNGNAHNSSQMVEGSEVSGQLVLALPEATLMSLDETSEAEASEAQVQVLKKREFTKEEFKRHMFEFLNAKD